MDFYEQHAYDEDSEAMNELIMKLVVATEQMVELKSMIFAREQTQAMNSYNPWPINEINTYEQLVSPSLKEAFNNIMQSIQQLWDEAATMPSYGKIVERYEFSDDFSSFVDEEEETEEKVKEAEDVSFKAPLLYKELKPYVPPITFPSRLHKSKWNKWFSELISLNFIVNIYLPLLIVCRNMPMREKFFQDLITYRCKFETLEFR